MMTLRERLMTVFKGGKADRVPWTIYKWILHAAVGEESNPFQDQGLTLIDSSRIFKETYNDVQINVEKTGSGKDRQVITAIQTPAGEITEKASFDPNFGSRWVKEHFIKTVDDFKVMKYVYDHMSIEPDWDDYVGKDKLLGDAGIVLGEILPIPVMWLMVEIMGTETWCESMMLHTAEFEELLESLTKVYKRQVEIAADSPAEVVWFPDNVTGSIVSPKTFETYCTPIYEWACKVMKDSSKLSFAHYDGDNIPLKDGIDKSGLDIIEAFTPPPMERMTVAEARKAWPDKVLSINFPGNLFTEPVEVIEKYTRQYMEEGGDDGNFVVGCTEEFDFSRFEHTFGAMARAMSKF